MFIKTNIDTQAEEILLEKSKKYILICSGKETDHRPTN
jgi:hypothetical protein